MPAKQTNGSTTPNGYSRPEARTVQSHDGIASSASQTIGTTPPLQAPPPSPTAPTKTPRKTNPKATSACPSKTTILDRKPPPTRPSYEQTSWPDQQPKQRFGSSTDRLPTLRSVSSPMPSQRKGSEGKADPLKNPWDADDVEEWGKEREVKMDFE
ncbi:hypothetical protein MRB53_041060 [Persea americana]|nr:hypothetical protein MRB53_041060 [Persea americana]